MKRRKVRAAATEATGTPTEHMTSDSGGIDQWADRHRDRLAPASGRLGHGYVAVREKTVSPAKA
jgi:hypothetical protein